MKRYDVYTRFARRHLSAREERAVYLTLVGHQAESWLAAEIAERNHLDEAEVERVLGRFEEAGIAEGVWAPEGRRYRWRSDMNYLFGESGHSPEWVDPVCGMPVTDGTPYAAKDAEGRSRRFCSSLCLAAFRASPGAFSGPGPVQAAVGGTSR